jgi:cytochrome c6
MGINVTMLILVVMGLLFTVQGWTRVPARRKIAATFCLIFSQIGIASATDLANGKAVFDSSCVGCHTGGGNIFNSGKGLSKKALQKNKFYSQKTIEELVLHGKAQMPAYGAFTSPKGNPMPAKLSNDDVSDVAAYTIDQANMDWVQ